MGLFITPRKVVNKEKLLSRNFTRCCSVFSVLQEKTISDFQAISSGHQLLGSLNFLPIFTVNKPVSEDPKVN